MDFTLLENFLTIIGVFAIFKFIVYVFLFFNDQDSYIEFLVIYKCGAEDAQENIEYPFGNMIDLFESSGMNNELNEVFFIGCPGNNIKNIKVLKYDDRKRKYKHFKKFKINTVLSGEYLYVYAPLYETIPDYQLSCRIRGQKLIIDFGYNGKNGIVNKRYLKIKRDCLGFLYNYFRNEI